MALFTDMYLRVLKAVQRDDEGQGLAEYALILALIAIVAIIALCGGLISAIMTLFTGRRSVYMLLLKEEWEKVKSEALNTF